MQHCPRPLAYAEQISIFKDTTMGPMIPKEMKYTVVSRYLEFQGSLWNTSRYPYLDIYQSRGIEENNKSNNHI